MTMPKKKTGRPLLKIDPKMVERLAKLHCTQTEITTILGCDRKTIYNRFSPASEKGHQVGNVRLRRLQWKAAARGNATMLIFLGKQYLGQSDRHELTGTDGTPLVPVGEPAELAAQIHALIATVESRRA